MTERMNQSRADALDDVSYLARSENRVRILNVLSKQSYHRRDLVDEIDVSSATAGRILTEFQSRGWVKRTQDGYVATPTGQQVTTEFESIINCMEAINHLGDAVEWIPSDELDIGLHEFSDVTVRRPERNDPAEITDFFTDLLKKVTSIHVLTHLVPIEAKETTMVDGLRTGRLTVVNHVITTELLDYLRDHPAHQARWVDLISAGATVYSYDGPIPCNLFILGETVILGNSHSTSGNPYACLVSDSSTIRSWARDVIDRYQKKADPVDARDMAKDVQG